MSSDDYCELCDLPKSQCVHGRPPQPPAQPAPKPRKKAAPARPSKPAGATPSATTTRPVQRRWTPPDALKPAIVTILEDAGGELEADRLFLALELMVQDQLLPGDREKTPEGELRWRYAARRARQALISDGLMVKGEPGVWKLA